MNLMNKNGLVIRLAIIVVFAASAVGFFATQIFYRITYINEVALTKQKIEQLNLTVSATVSIATYLVDEELMREVVNGLVSNDIIKSVAIVTDGLRISSVDAQENDTTLNFVLFSPFEATREVGTLHITPNFTFIEQGAKKIGFDNAIATAVQVTVVTVIIILVAYFIITNPIIKVAKELHRIRPGTKERIHLPKNHQESEIGTLVKDINGLLEKTEFQIEEERNLRNEVQRLSKHFQMLFEYSTSPIVLTEQNGNILLYNRSFSSLLKKINQPLKKNFGLYLKDLFHESEHVEQQVKTILDAGEISTGEFQMLNQQASEDVWVQAIISATIDKNYKAHYQITLHDISQRKQQLESLSHKAHTDDLTQLLNRRGAEQALNSFIANATPFVLLLLDLNKFKPINDIYGHETGDDILRHIAAQLSKSLRRRDILSRWGGDEFVIVLPNLTLEEAKEVSEKIYQHIGVSYFVEKHNISLSVSASIGGVLFPDGEKTLHALIEKADNAMYRTKELQKSGERCFVTFFSELS